MTKITNKRKLEKKKYNKIKNEKKKRFNKTNKIQENKIKHKISFLPLHHIFR